MKPSKFLLEFWVLIGLVVTTTIAIILLVLRLTQWNGSERFAAKISTNETKVVILVQVIAHTLGMVMVQSLCALIKIQFRSSTILKKAVSFEYVRVLNALSSPRPLFSENWSLTTLTILFTILSAVPGALWSGAISPNIVRRHVTANVQIPSYPVNNLSAIYDAGDVQNVKGDFAFEPLRYTSLLVISAQQSSNRNTSNPEQTPHAKLDNTGYVYLTRSFGAGATVGLSEVSINTPVISYIYSEPGIVATVDCLKNSTSNFYIQQNTSSYNSNGIMGTSGFTNGTYPNGEKVSATWLFGSLIGDLFAIDSYYDSNFRRAQVVLASAGENWQQQHQFNQVQCEASFKAHNIEISVSAVQKTIATRILDEVPWPAYGDNVTYLASQALRRMTETDNGYAGSRVGRALWVNAAKLNYVSTGNYSTDEIPQDIMLKSVSNFVISVFENSLVAIGACRAECAKSTTDVTANVEIRSVVYGTATFIYIITGLNTVLVIAAFSLVVLRKAWTRTVDLDFADVADVAINASRGGTDLFNQFAAYRSWANAKFTLGDVRRRWPAIVAVQTKPDLGASVQLQKWPWMASKNLNVSTSYDRLLDPTGD